MHENERILKFSPLIRNLYNSARETLGFEPHVSISIIDSTKNANNPLGKTAHYSPSERKIALYTRGRHIKDIMRSLAHELVHHNQNCRGDFETAGGTMPGYAQEDGHLREMEREAYEVGNLIFRDWEDNLKDKGGKPLFSSTAPYVPAPTSGVVGGRLLEENKMTDKLTKVQLQEIIDKESQKLLKEQTRSVEWIRASGQFRNSPEFKKTIEKLKAAGKLRPGTVSYNRELNKAAEQYGKRTGLTSKRGATGSQGARQADPAMPVPKTQLQGDDPKTTAQKAAPKAAPKPKRRKRKFSSRTETIQHVLKKLGYDLGPRGADGYYGPATRAAVGKFQTDSGLKADKIVGKNTISALNKAYRKYIDARTEPEKPKKRVMPHKQPSGPMKTWDEETGEVYYDIPKAGGGTHRQTVKKAGYVPWAERIFGKGFGGKKGVKEDLHSAILDSVLKDNDMNKKITESQLRNIIQGVIQEMFEEDLNEDNMGMPANAESQEASEEDAEAASAAGSTTGAGGSTGEDFQVKEDLQSTKGHFSDNDSGAVDYETDAMEEDLGKWLDWCSKRLKMPRGSPGVQNCAKKKQEKEKAKNLKEDSGEEEKENYKKNVEDDKKHLKNLEKDIKDDEKQEKLEESFFPKGRSTREKARKELNESLMKRWGFTKKEK